MDKRQLIEELKRNPKNVRVRKLCKIAEAFDFRFRGGKIPQPHGKELLKILYEDAFRTTRPKLAGV